MLYNLKEHNFLGLTYPIIRLKVKIFQFLRLSTKFWAVLRQSVNLIETLLDRVPKLYQLKFSV